ncbi:hypothetical protein BaRGS_00035008 [Batillaria attramentaria]|uniref:SCAN box domain-containing protein n=1 Tax=Batillaria attramentaria TaxID=370345 RepID=A0ABD0JFW4_9CAEN
MELELRMRGTAELNTTNNNDQVARAPKLPAFNENSDKMDAYLERFERFAASNNWGQETWAVKLSALLTGKALDFYARQPRDDAEDNKLKGELLKHYDFTEEGYRRRFRNCKPEDGETPNLFVERLSSYLQTWIQLAGLREEYADLRDLIIKEQMLTRVPKRWQHIYGNKRTSP